MIRYQVDGSGPNGTPSVARYAVTCHNGEWISYGPLGSDKANFYAMTDMENARLHENERQAIEAEIERIGGEISRQDQVIKLMRERLLLLKHKLWELECDDEIPDDEHCSCSD